MLECLTILSLVVKVIVSSLKRVVLDVSGINQVHQKTYKLSDRFILACSWFLATMENK